jgi:hypothetical protein
MDAECIPICDALNSLPGITTFESCCGHGKERHVIFFRAMTIEALHPILRCAESSAWRLRVYWSNGGEFAAFILEGPIGLPGMPGGADDFASWLHKLISE